MGFRVCPDGSAALVPDGLLMREKHLQQRLNVVDQQLADALALSQAVPSAALRLDLLEASKLLSVRDAQLQQAVEAGTLMQRQLELTQADFAREAQAAAQASAACAVEAKNLVLENARLQEQLEKSKDRRDLHRVDQHKAIVREQRAHQSRDTIRSKGLWLSAETDSRFRAMLEKEPRPEQKHLAKLIDAQLRSSESKSGRCVWPKEILQWYARCHPCMHTSTSTQSMYQVSMDDPSPLWPQVCHSVQVEGRRL